MPSPPLRSDLRAVILAAGVGKRLGAAHDRPKCLLAFDGATLLSRHLDLLGAAGVADITIVVGHQAAQVIAAAGHRARCIENPDYRSGSLVSLAVAGPVLRSGAPIMLMDADVLYDRRLLAALLDAPGDNLLLLDRDLEPGDEPVKLCIAAGRIVDFRKRPDTPGEWHGESVGFFRFAADAAAELADRADAALAAGARHLEYEEPIRDMIRASPPDRFGYVDITGLPWTEIDFPEDVAKAMHLTAELCA